MKNKNILIVTGHPAQIHNFRNLKKLLEANGANVTWLATEKEMSKYLLNCYGIDYHLLKRPSGSLISKVKVFISNTRLAMKLMRRNKIDLVVSRISPYVTMASWLKRIKHIGLTDTESAGIYDKVFSGMIHSLITADSFKRTLRDDQIRVASILELFYLHPNRYQPDRSILDILGVKEGESYVILRFVSWGAYHDKGITGFTDDNKRKAVEAFSKYAKVFISAEGDLPEDLEKYKISIPAERMHDALAYANMFFGESATMASESGVLGTYAIYLNENFLGYTDELERHNLLSSFKTDEESQLKAIDKAVEILSMGDLSDQLKSRRDEFLNSHIDLTAFLNWYIENFPDSYKEIQNDPQLQNNFK